MSLSKYNALLKVMEHNSITKAAEDIGYTQSGISYMIKTLENEIGFPLLIRSKEGVIPTENAIKLKPVLKKLIDTHKELESAIYEINNASLECIKVGSFNSMLLKWVPQILKRFFIKFPDADINLIEGNEIELNNMLSSGELDLAFTAGSAPEGFKFMKLVEDPFLITLPKDHPLAFQEKISLEDICEYKLAITDEDYYHWLTDYMEKNKVPHSELYKYSMKDTSSIMSLVANNLAISILPQRSITMVPDTIVLREFSENHYRSLGITYPNKKHLLPIIVEFINTAKNVVTNKKL